MVIDFVHMTRQHLHNTMTSSLYYHDILSFQSIGIGFKLAPAFGQLLTDLALDRPLLFDISSLRSDRFSNKYSIAKL